MDVLYHYSGVFVFSLKREKSIIRIFLQHSCDTSNNLYRKEKKYKMDPSNTANWQYEKAPDTYTCPKDKKLKFQYLSTWTDRYQFTRTMKVYECEDCSSCPLRPVCTKAKEGNNRKLYVNEKRRRTSFWILEG